MSKRTLRGTKLKKAKTSGFRVRSRTSSGKNILRAKRRKGRKCLV
nr:ribosomal protein L34 [Rhodomonas sp. NIES-698]